MFTFKVFFCLSLAREQHLFPAIWDELPDDFPQDLLLGSDGDHGSCVLQGREIMEKWKIQSEAPKIVTSWDI